MSSRLRRAAGSAAAVLLVGLLTAPGQVLAATSPRTQSLGFFGHVSQSVAIRYWLAHPDRAPSSVRATLVAAQNTIAAARAAVASGASVSGPMKGSTPPGEFNHDKVGFPQNEESVTFCQNKPNVVLEGTNDYRGLLDPEQNFTGWYLSTDWGRSVAAEGLLPHADFGGGVLVPSGGDPVMASDSKCNLYGASIDFDPDVLFPSGIAVYKTTPAILQKCHGFSSKPECWPKSIVVAQAPDDHHFLDKDWIAVDDNHVWVSWSDFSLPDPANPAAFTASIFAAQCNTALTACSAPILISGADQDIQFSDVTIGPDGRTYITWVEVQGELTDEPQTFITKLRIAEKGSTEFGDTQVVETISKAMGFGGFLASNSFRVASYPKSTVQMVNHKPRIWVTWDECSKRLFGVLCEEPQIFLTHSDNDGASWSKPERLSMGGQNYFPTLASNGTGQLAVAWYTSRFDPTFHNRQDVELVWIDSKSGKVIARDRLTRPSNETESDPLLGAFFIGDYFEVGANGGTAYVGFNANYRSAKVLGSGIAVPQQDNYLLTSRLGKH